MRQNYKIASLVKSNSITWNYQSINIHFNGNTIDDKKMRHKVLIWKGEGYDKGDKFQSRSDHITVTTLKKLPS